MEVSCYKCSGCTNYCILYIPTVHAKPTICPSEDYYGTCWTKIEKLNEMPSIFLTPKPLHEGYLKT